MKNKTIIITIIIGSILVLGACAGKKDTLDINKNTLQEAAEQSSQDNHSLDIGTEAVMEEDISKEMDSPIYEESVLEGYTYIDGKEVPIKVGFEIENILRGETAYNQLHELNQEIEQPGEKEEYIIVTFNVSYIEGEGEELFMFENRASLKEAALYFSLANSNSNAQDMTAYLDNSIYNISVLKGQSSQGGVAFLQEKGNKEPLCFVGFGTTMEFHVNGL